jgi:hypothetical protein
VLAGAFDGHDPKPIPHGLDEGLLSGAESEGMADSSGAPAGIRIASLINQ